MASEYEAEDWWRVVAPDKSVWCETSDEEDARERMRPGDQLMRLWSCRVSQWRPVSL